MVSITNVAVTLTSFSLWYEYLDMYSRNSSSSALEEPAPHQDQDTDHTEAESWETALGEAPHWAHWVEEAFSCPSARQDMQCSLLGLTLSKHVQWSGICILSAVVGLLLCKISTFCRAVRWKLRLKGMAVSQVSSVPPQPSTKSLQQLTAEGCTIGTCLPAEAQPGNVIPGQGLQGKASCGKGPPGKGPPGKGPPGKGPPGKCPPGKGPPAPQGKLGKSPAHGVTDDVPPNCKGKGKASPPKSKAPPPKGKAPPFKGSCAQKGQAPAQLGKSGCAPANGDAAASCAPVFRNRIRWKEVGEVGNTIFAELDRTPLSDEAAGFVRGLIERPVPKPKAFAQKVSGEIVIKDANRAQKIAINFRKGPHFDGLCLGLRTLNLQIPMEEEDFERLRRVWPTSDELRSVKNFKGPKESMRNIEQCVLRLADIPRADSRLRLLQLAKELQELQAAFATRMTIMKTACEELLHAPVWDTLLSEVLRMGNFINQGAGHRGVRGFTMDALLELKALKGAGGASAATALHCLCVTCAHKDVDFSNKLHQQLKSVPCAAQVTLQNLREKLSGLKASVNFAAQELMLHKSQYEIEDPVEASCLESQLFKLKLQDGMESNSTNVKHTKEVAFPSVHECQDIQSKNPLLENDEVSETSTLATTPLATPRLDFESASTWQYSATENTPRKRRGTAAVITPSPLSRPLSARSKAPFSQTSPRVSPFVKRFYIKSVDLGNDEEEETSTMFDDESIFGKEEEELNVFEPTLDVPSSQQVRALKASGTEALQQRLEDLATLLDSPTETHNIELASSLCDGQHSKEDCCTMEDWTHGDDCSIERYSTCNNTNNSEKDTCTTDSDTDDDDDLAPRFEEQHGRLRALSTDVPSKIDECSCLGPDASPVTWKMSGSDSECGSEDTRSEVSEGSKWYCEADGIENAWVSGASARWPETWQTKSAGGFWQTGTPCETPDKCTPRSSIGTPRLGCTPRSSLGTPRISSRSNSPRKSPRKRRIPQILLDARAGGVKGPREKLLGELFGTLNNTSSVCFTGECSNFTEPTSEYESVNVCAGDFNIPFQDVRGEGFCLTSCRNQTAHDNMQPFGARRRLEVLTCEGHQFISSAEEQLAQIAEAANKCQKYFGVCTEAGESSDCMQLFSIVTQFLGNFRTAWQEVQKNSKWSTFLPKTMRKIPASSKSTPRSASSKSTPRSARRQTMSARGSATSSSSFDNMLAEEEGHGKESLSARETSSTKFESLREGFLGRRCSMSALSHMDSAAVPWNHEKLAVLAESPNDGERVLADS